MYLLIAVPENSTYKQSETDIIQLMDERGFTFVGVSVGTCIAGNCPVNDLEFESVDDMLILEDTELETLESDLRQLVSDKEIKIYIEE
jgi:hypothetical protein